MKTALALFWLVAFSTLDTHANPYANLDSRCVSALGVLLSSEELVHTRTDLNRALQKQFPPGTTYRRIAEIIGERCGRAAPSTNREYQVHYRKREIVVHAIEVIEDNVRARFVATFIFSEEMTLLRSNHTVSVMSD